MKRTRHLLTAWAAIQQRARRAQQLALFSDFDGTLVPIRRRPAQARLGPGVRDLLSRIASSGTTVGIVSGRRLADLRKKVGLPGVWYVGEHGFFLRGPGNRSFALATHREGARIRTAQRALLSRLRKLPGVEIEPKAAALAVHYRSAARREAELAKAVVAAVVRSVPGLRLMQGKRVWEILPARGVSKWHAIRFILSHSNKREGRKRLVFYLGDDATDERVFERMSGISVAVGSRRRTAARYFLRSPAEVKHFLERWQELTR